MGPPSGTPTNSCASCHIPTVTAARVSIVPPPRLWQTREVLHQCMVNPALSVKASLEASDCFIEKEELFGPLKLMYDSLIATGAPLASFASPGSDFACSGG